MKINKINKKAVTHCTASFFYALIPTKEPGPMLIFRGYSREKLV